MNIICKLFGHKPPQDGWRKGWGGYEYCKLSVPYKDGIGRQHVVIRGECPRCDKTYIVGKAHLPHTPQPAGAAGEAWEASQIAASVLANIAKKFSAELSASEKASIESARIALTTPPVASVEGLREQVKTFIDLIAMGENGLRSSFVPTVRDSMVRVPDFELIDSAGGAKGERKALDRAISARPTVRGDTPLFCAKLDESTPQPAEGDGAVTAPYGYEHDGHFWFAPGATPWVIHHATPLYTRPSAAALDWRKFPYSIAWCDGLASVLRECDEYGAAEQVEEIKAFVSRPSAAAAVSAAGGKVVAWLCSNEFPQRTVATASEGAMEAYRTLGRRIEPLVRQSDAPAAPKGEVVDEAMVERSADALVLGWNLHYPDAVRMAKCALSAATPRAEQGGQEVGNG